MSASTVVVTGMGVASALGTGVAAHRAALLAGTSGIRPVARFDTQELSTRLGATWPAWDGRVQATSGRERSLAATAAPFPLHELALVAAREAWSSAAPSARPERVALVLGTCFGQGFDEFAQVTRRVADALDACGPRITVSTACASSTNAIGLGRDLLLRGHADVVLAGGADTLLREALAGFSALGVLSPEPVAPFSSPPGTTLGEGAAFVVLERGDDAARHGARSWATIAGYGLSADAHHETTPHPGGDGVARALRSALADAGWAPDTVDFVSAHATGTANNDRTEWSVLARELGAPVVAGAKGHVGHTQGASGALELVLALICHAEGLVPPTLHFRGPRAGCPSDPVAQATPRPHVVARAIKLSAAFGGANAALAYACGSVSAASRPARVPVVLASCGVVGPTGAGANDAIDALVAARGAGPARAIDLDALGVDGRRLDRSARLLTAASALALGADGRRDPPTSTGLFVAATRMPAESSRRCTDSIRQRGLAATSANAFARMSVNAPSGACAAALGLMGPTTTVSIGEGSGLLALALATDWLATRSDASTILAGAVDDLAGNDPEEAEGAACLVAKRAPLAGPGAILIAGWAISGPRAAEQVAEDALAMAGLRAADALGLDVDAEPVRAACARFASSPSALFLDPRELWGVAPASRSAVMAAVAHGALAAGRADTALLVSAHDGASVAIVLQKKAPQ